MSIRSIALAMVLLVLLATGAWADFSTPFVENSAVGAVSEGYGHILADESDDGPVFTVLVRSDTNEKITIRARAEKGVVPPELIGRQVIIRAELVKAPTKNGHGEGAELKILSVKDGRKKNP